MTPSQESKCHTIIHTTAISAGAGNLVPIPGLGVAVDVIAMTAMTVSLASVLGGSLTEEAAKGMVVLSIKSTILKQPVKVIAKELSKLIPGLGQIVAPAITIGLIEATGWALAADLESKFSK